MRICSNHSDSHGIASLTYTTSYAQHQHFYLQTIVKTQPVLIPCRVLDFKRSLHELITFGYAPTIKCNNLKPILMWQMPNDTWSAVLAVILERPTLFETMYGKGPNEEFIMGTEIYCSLVILPCTKLWCSSNPILIKWPNQISVWNQNELSKS